MTGSTCSRKYLRKDDGCHERPEKRAKRGETWTAHNAHRVPHLPKLKSRETHQGNMTPKELRLQCRNGVQSGPTFGRCDGYIQANLIVLPENLAHDFQEFCRLNAAPCPLLGYTKVGNPHELNEKRLIQDDDFDLRRDFPRYSVYEKGVLVDSPTDIVSHWRPEHVGFLLGCSFSFEACLKAAGFPSRNEAQGRVVSMYRTNHLLKNSGHFVDVPCVVSMRPYKERDADKIYEITARFPKLHGCPVGHGYAVARDLGIDVDSPDYGDCTLIEKDEIPFFWACGVTAQLAALSLANEVQGPILAHYPGHMLVTDWKENF